MHEEKTFLFECSVVYYHPLVNCRYVNLLGVGGSLPKSSAESDCLCNYVNFLVPTIFARF